MTVYPPEIGVIEGFYGRPWSTQSRLAMMGWLKQLGVDSYLYAPKADSHLRKEWRRPWPSNEQGHLNELAKTCRSTGIRFYVGLSPYALYRAYGPDDRRALRARVEEIARLDPHGLALLFDDMPGDVDALAERQLEIIGDVVSALQGRAVIVCPSYYSDDPILDKVFGLRPANYLETLAAGLDDKVGLFWTGPQVCSEEITTAHLHAVRQRGGDRLHLWDNYPVNDSKSRSGHIYQADIAGRGPAADLLRGHWCNAMNQPALSLPAIASLSRLYGKQGTEQSAVFEEAGLSAELLEACKPLAVKTAQELDSTQLDALNSVAAGSSAAASELADWLAGGYRFDPACLTD